MASYSYVPGYDQNTGKPVNAPAASQTYTPLESAGMGAINGATFGTQDKIVGALGATQNSLMNSGAGPAIRAAGTGLANFQANHPVLNKVAQDVAGPLANPILSGLITLAATKSSNSSWTDAYSQIRDATAQKFQQAKEQNPKSYTAGQIGGTVAGMAAGDEAVGALRGLPVLSKIASGLDYLKTGVSSAADSLPGADTAVGKLLIGGAKGATKAATQAGVAGGLSQNGGSLQDKAEAAGSAALGVGSRLNPLKDGKFNPAGLVDDVVTAAGGGTGATPSNLVGKGLLNFARAAPSVLGSVVGQDVGAQSSTSQQSDESSLPPPVNIDELSKQLGIDTSTPDGQQKQQALAGKDLNNVTSDNVEPGASPSVPNVITRPDGSQYLESATGAPIELG